MPFGFDDAAAVVSLVAVTVTAFQACIKALIILGEARSYSRDVSGIRLLIEVEKHKLLTWACEVGLSQEPRVLRVNVQDVYLVPKILGHLQLLLSDLDELKHTYDLNLQETSHEIMSLEDDESAFERLGITEDDGSRTMQRQIFEERKSPWKVLKWITFDEQRVKKLVDQVKLYVVELEHLLEHNRQKRIDRAVDVILRNAVLNTVNEQDLDMIGQEDCGQQSSRNAIAAAARFKKQGLLLGVVDSENSESGNRLRRQNSLPTSSRPRRPSSHTLIPRYSNSDLTAMRLSKKHLQISETETHAARAIVYYANHPALLEFRNESGLDSPTAKDRMFKVSKFLHNLDPSFHGLNCRGYIHVNGRYAYVFDLPSDTISPQAILPTARVKTKPNPTFSFRTLRALYDLPKPHLNLRLSFAITVVETLLQLHTSGWLHKEFRPHNVLFIRTSDNNAEIVSDSSSTTRNTTTLTSDKHTSNEPYLHLPPYVAGYAYARADDPLEATEPLESDLEADLYRHPASFGSARTSKRTPYCKAFDVFSVGCIMLELGLWESLVGVMMRIGGIDAEKGANGASTGSNPSSTAGGDAVNGQGQDARDRSMLDLMRLKHDVLMNSFEGTKPGGVFGELATMMGEGYCGMVRDMMGAFDWEKSEMEGETSETDCNKRLLELEMKCLERLRAMVEVL